MERQDKYHKPFTLAWFLQRTTSVLKEKRLPDMTLFKKKVNALFLKQNVAKDALYTRIPSELLEPASHRHSRPLIISRIEKEDQKFINNYFDRIYVTSPHSRSDTRLAMVRKLISLGIQATIIETDDSESNTPVDSRDLLIVLKDARKNNFRRILRLKDTVLFSKNFHDKFRDAIENIPDDWQLLCLGAFGESRNNNSNLDGTFALGIDSSIFKPLEKGLQKSLSSHKPFPLGIEGLPREKCMVLLPNLVIDSDEIRKKGQEFVEQSFKWNLKDYDEGPEPDLVSVIMPAYNAERTIEKSIRSILRQSYRNIELIVADDCSRDNTREIVKAIGKMDSRVHLVERSVNQGCYFARNDALRATSGKYIAVQDADDISLEKRIEKQLIPIVSGDALFTLSWIMRSRLKITELNMDDEPGMIKKVLDHRVLRPDKSYAYWDRPILGFMTSVFERSLFEELGLFWEYRFGADAEYFERIIFSKTGRILKPDEPNVHSFLLGTGSIPGIYRRVEQILLISAEMNEQNITRSYHTDHLNEFISNYRAKFTGIHDYNYPKFE